MLNNGLDFKNLPNVKADIKPQWKDTGVLFNNAEFDNVVKELGFSYLGTTENEKSIYSRNGYNFIFTCEPGKTIKYAKVILSTTIKIDLADAYKLYAKTAQSKEQ